MTKTLVIIPDKDNIASTRTLLEAQYPDVEIVAATAEAGLRAVQLRLRQGLEVVVARAATANAIRQANLNITVVEIPRTHFDILHAIEAANVQGKKIAFIAYSEKIWGIEMLTESLGINFRQYTVRFQDDFEKIVLAAYADGAELIIGGFTVIKSAKKHNLPCAMIQISPESLLLAAREANQIREALKIEAAKRGVFSTILDYSYEGIVTIDRNHNITAFNPLAQKITRINKDEAIGRPVEKIFPQLHLGKVVDTAASDLHCVMTVGNNTIMCNKIPILVNGTAYGAVATFHDISKIQEMEAVVRQKIYARGHIARYKFENIAAKSPIMLKTIDTARQFAITNSSVLILGETGTGKEVFAQSIHNASRRAKGPFVAINCAALPSHLLESELFGYVSGAFTGASKEGKPGLFEVAHGGTIFLDEIAEMDYVNQGRLLRVLQEKTVVRLGSHKVLPVDVRVIAATNKDLEALMQENKFRDDLYYRLNVLSLTLPALNQRREDIGLYAKCFLQDFASETGKNYKLTPSALQVLESYSWPGNIRELKNLMERLSAIAGEPIINSSALQEVLQRKDTEPNFSPKEKRLLKETTEALEAAKGNYTLAAEILGINRSTLWRRIQKFRLDY